MEGPNSETQGLKTTQLKLFSPFLKRLIDLVVFGHFYEGENFSDFLFVFLRNNPFLKKDLP